MWCASLTFLCNAPPSIPFPSIPLPYPPVCTAGISTPSGDGVQHKKKKSIDPNNFFNPNSTWR